MVMNVRRAQAVPDLCPFKRGHVVHLYLYIVRAGSGPGSGSCATGPFIPGSRLHYFFNCCIFFFFPFA